jgi:uncharacterized membrane protein YcgQ (UPF0703/DUF1980 family)
MSKIDFKLSDMVSKLSILVMSPFAYRIFVVHFIHMKVTILSYISQSHGFVVDQQFVPIKWNNFLFFKVVKKRLYVPVLIVDKVCLKQKVLLVVW